MNDWHHLVKKVVWNDPDGKGWQRKLFFWMVTLTTSYFSREELSWRQKSFLHEKERRQIQQQIQLELISRRRFLGIWRKYSDYNAVDGHNFKVAARDWYFLTFSFAVFKKDRLFFRGNNFTVKWIDCSNSAVKQPITVVINQFLLLQRVLRL